MITVTPDEPYITLTTLSVPRRSRVYLSGCKRGRSLKTEHFDDSNAVKIGPVPGDLCNGVYTLLICHPGACATTYSTKVNVQMQPTPAPIVDYDPTDPHAGETVMECCDTTDPIPDTDPIDDPDTAP